MQDDIMTTHLVSLRDSLSALRTSARKAYYDLGDLLAEGRARPPLDIRDDQKLVMLHANLERLIGSILASEPVVQKALGLGPSERFRLWLDGWMEMYEAEFGSESYRVDPSVHDADIADAADALVGAAAEVGYDRRQLIEEIGDPYDFLAERMNSRAVTESG